MPRHADRCTWRRCAALVQRFRRLVAGMDLVEFEADDRTPDAASRQFETLGEAPGRVSDPLRTDHSEVPWRVLKELRNLLIRGYEDVAVDRVRAKAMEGVPALLGAVEGLRAGRQSALAAVPRGVVQARAWSCLRSALERSNRWIQTDPPWWGPRHVSRVWIRRPHEHRRVRRNSPVL